MTRIRAVSALLLALLFSSMAADAQLPRGKAKYPNSMSTRQIAQYLQSAQFARMVTVDSGGSGDYTSIAAALAHVAAQTGRSQFNRWMVMVYPGVTSASGLGQYDEAVLSVPSYTTLTGVVAPWGNGGTVMGVPVVHPTGTSGSLVTVGQNASLQNLMIHVTGLTGATVAVEVLGVSGNAVNFTNVSINASSSLADHQLDLLKVSTGSFVGHNVHLSRSGANTATRGVVSAAGNAGITLYGGRIDAGSGSLAAVENLDDTAVSLFGTRLGVSTAQLKRSSTGTIVTQGVSYTTSSGVIDNNPVMGAYAATLPATCSPGAGFVDSTAVAPRVCACTATDTWRCAQTKITSATAPYACAAGVAGDEYYDTTTPTPCWCNGSAWQPVADGGNCS